MTLDVYADLFDEDLDDVAANLDAAIRNAAVRCGQTTSGELTSQLRFTSYETLWS
jgi:hypothetical protein